MKKYSLLVMGFMVAISIAQGSGWQKLKPLDTYSGRDDNLGKNVAYMEIRFYKSPKSNDVFKTLKLYKKPLSSYPQETIAKFKALPQRHSNKESYLRFRDNGNVFFIDTKGKIFWTDERKDMKEMLGKVDTPAELALALWLDYKNGWQSYKNTPHSYKIKRATIISKCIVDTMVGSVDENGYHDLGNNIRHIVRTKCKKRNHTQFISHKKIDYESYNRIEMDDKGNLYVLGYVNKDKTYHSDSYSVLDKYTSQGKLLWSKKLRENFPYIQVVNRFTYIIDDNKINAKYSPDGKSVSFKQGEIAIKTRKGKGVKHTPKVLPSEKKNIEFSVSDYVVDKKGNVYVVGVEIFYPNGVPSGSKMCGNNGQVEGALIAKLNSKGRIIWAKVIDRDD